MAVTVRSKAETIETITGNTTVTEPAGAASGDVLIAHAVAESGTSLAKPSGWTDLYGPSTQGAFMVLVSYISRGGSAPSLTWSVSGTSKYREVYVVCLKSDVTSVVLDSQSTSGTFSGTITNPDPPASVAVASSSLAMTGGVNWSGSGAGGWGMPAGYTVQTVNAAGDDGILASKVLSTAGSENPAAFSNGGGSNDGWDGFTVTFTDAVGGGQVPYQPQYARSPVLAQ